MGRVMSCNAVTWGAREMTESTQLFVDDTPPKDVTSIEWYTPAAEIKLVHRVFDGPPELDPMSCEVANRIVGAQRFFDKDTDGLAQPWRARTLYINPVTGLTKPAWHKLCEHFEAGDFDVAIWAMFSVQQFQTLQNGDDDLPPPPFTPSEFPFCVPSSRTNWLRGDPSQLTMFGPQAAGNPRNGTAFILIDRVGTYTERFVEAFSTLGAVSIPVSKPAMDVCTLCQGHPNAVVLHRWQATIPIEPPSQNCLHNKGGRRWAYRKLRDQYTESVHTYLSAPKATRMRRVRITRLWGKKKRAYDHGNLIGGCKPLLDALVIAGLLVDDSPKYVEAYYYQEKSPNDKGGVRVVLEELE